MTFNVLYYDLKFKIEKNNCMYAECDRDLLLTICLETKPTFWMVISFGRRWLVGWDQFHQGFMDFCHINILILHGTPHV